MAADLRLDYVQTGAFLAVASATSVVCSLVLVWAMNLLSERTVVVVACLIGLATGALSPFVANVGGMLALAVGLGVTISVLGTMCNVLIVEGAPPHLQGRFLSALHSMYGLGSAAAASVVGWALARGMHWSNLYSAVVPLLLLLLGFATARLGRAGGGRARERTVQSPRLTRFQTFVVLLFVLYVGGEGGTSLWLSSYLVAARGFTGAMAAAFLTGYFLVMTVTRLVCAAWIKPEREAPVLCLALIVPLAAFAIGHAGPAWVLLLMGTFGAFFPVFLARLSRRFPTAWRSMTLWTMTGIPATVGLTSLGVGRLADLFGMRWAMLLPPGLLAVSLALLLVFFRTERREDERTASPRRAASA